MAKPPSDKPNANNDSFDGDDDSALFRSMMSDVTPITSRQAPRQQSKPAPRARSREADEIDIRKELANISWYDIENATTGEELSYQGGGLPHATWRRLQRGQYTIEATLDLHGMRRDEAALATKRFIKHAQERGQRCIHIIHGKGQNSPQGAVLRHVIDGQLRRSSPVTAFCSARPADGGIGAVYVLLKKPKP